MTRLRYCFVIFHHLAQGSSLNCCCKSGFVVTQHFSWKHLERSQLVIPDVFLFILGKPVNEEGALSQYEQYDRAEPAGFSASWSRDSLFDHTAAKVSIHKPAFRVRHNLAQYFVFKPRRASKPLKRLVLENSHKLSPNAPYIASMQEAETTSEST